MVEYEPKTIIIKDEGLTLPNVGIAVGFGLPTYVRHIRPALAEELTTIDGKVPGKQIWQINEIAKELRRSGVLQKRKKPVKIVFELSEDLS